MTKTMFPWWKNLHQEPRKQELTEWLTMWQDFSVTVSETEVCLREVFGIGIQKILGGERRLMAYTEERPIASF